MRATAVIGAAFGDEGKGLMTDYFCSVLGGCDSTVVRFNGGPQAGHTVVTPEGKRHVFHHFGSGSLLGATTYLSKFFLVNPFSWQSELPFMPTDAMLCVDEAALVTTPYDVLLNQALEEHRGAARHGSCGNGINETVTRSQKWGVDWSIRVSDLAEEGRLRELLAYIRKDYVPQRLYSLSIEKVSDFIAGLLDSKILIDNFVSACRAFHLRSVAIPFSQAVEQTQHVVFEGAQGLCLSEDHRFFPYVTRSRTGLTNVIDLAHDVGIEIVDAVYVTRAYSTRHGAGPFPSEMKGLVYEDHTNVPNEYQGSLRFGFLDVDLLRESILHDLAKCAHNGVTIHPKIAVTCLDQVDDRDVTVRHEGKLVSVKKKGLPYFINDVFDNKVKVEYVSYGPTRNSVIKLPYANPELQVKLAQELFG